ncbi:peptide chain release factor N(5)-glutamine methyltransferase [Pelagibacterales bacterium SAG-MED34]|nr:peptide chain release factor N(5)-glutamine methyltransferase [Pelagibacterales bacterium SAG-MED34]
MNYNQILKEGENFLKKNKIKNSYLDTELILSKVTNKKREEILLNTNFKLKDKDIIKFKNYLFRRHHKEPMAYILGYKHFWKHKFLTNKSVLIPRPDTELIVEEAIKYLPIDKSKKILDVGTGSGCIVVSLIKERPKCVATAIDISRKAINVAKTNAKLHQLANKINFINIDIDKYKSYNYDLIISNPPYINSIELNRLDDDIKLHEPKIALSGGFDGFRNIKKVIVVSKKLLKINGKLIIEIGHKQKNQSVKILNENGFYINKISKDLSGKERCITSTKL